MSDKALTTAKGASQLRISFAYVSMVGATVAGFLVMRSYGVTTMMTTPILQFLGAPGSGVERKPAPAAVAS